MKIAIIGAGFTGLSAAYKLLKNGHSVTIFEKENLPGGLALGFKTDKWDWSLEKHYHHFFTNDKAIINLAKEINYEIIIKRPKTSTLIDNSIYQLDSPLNLLLFSKLSVIDRFRMAFVLGVLRYNPLWRPLEKIRATKFLPIFMGKKAYETVWKPLIVGKFGNYADDISLAWFWARIKKRTTKLAYPKGGFLNFAEKLTEIIREKGGKVYFGTEVTEIKNEKDKIKVCLNDLNHLNKNKVLYFDKTIVTLPSFLFLKIAKDLPEDYRNQLNKLKSLGAINLVLRLKEQFLKDDTYWLSICEKDWPLLAIVEHTNFMNKKYYNNEHLVYIGNYLPCDHPYFKKSKEELLKIYTPFLKKISPNFSREAGYCSAVQLFKESFAQPVIPVNYSKIMPPHETPLKNVYLANIEQVYPWDRGTNYAVELGEKIADIII